VFDNAREQEQQIQESFLQWQSDQDRVRRNSAWFLIAGSGVGIGFLVVAGTRKWLPRPGIWLPTAALLVCSSALGLYWLQPPAVQTLATVPSSNPLPNYGVRSEPPPNESPIDWPTQAAGFDAEKSGKSLEDVAEFESSSLAFGFYDFSLPSLELSVDGAMPASGENVQPLPEMNLWADLARSSERTKELYALRDKDSGGEDRRGSLDRFGAARRAMDDRLGKLPAASFQPVGDAPHGEPAAAGIAPTADDQSVQPAGRTIYWHPAVATNPSGTAQLTFAVPEGPLAYRVIIHARNGRQMGSSSCLVPTIVGYPRTPSSE
jgi:hypothetical protein